MHSEISCSGCLSAFNYHTIIFLSSEETLEATSVRAAEVKAFELAAPVDGFETWALTHVWHLSLGSAEVEILVLAGFVCNTIKVEWCLVESAEASAEEWSVRCLGWDDIGSIKDNRSISCSKDLVGVDSRNRCLDEVLNEVTLGGFVDDFYNSCFLADFGDLIAVLLARILNSLTTLLMNVVQLCDIDLAAGNITDQLGLCLFVGFCDLFVNLCVGVVVNLVDSRGLNLCVWSKEAIKSLCNVIEKASKIEVKVLISRLNRACCNCIRSAGLLLSSEISNHFFVAISWLDGWHCLDLLDSSWLGPLHCSELDI